MESDIEGNERMKCAYCRETMDNASFRLEAEPLFPYGRFIKGELKLLHKGDCVCYDCWVVRKPLK